MMSTTTKIARAFKGTLVHCPSLGQIEILEDHLLREDSTAFHPRKILIYLRVLQLRTKKVS